ncbi:MAG: HlyD family efflux transporter periplasmic adaptor subunit, partial [Acidobacteria bacterium]|nr:HlyD family efflux transporter periplasmic adaptor subunit [Acidobacteriota bacterium]
MGRIIKIFVILAIISGVGAGGYAWLQGRETGGSQFKLVEVSRGEITEKSVAVGQIEPRMKFHVKSKISGIVKIAAVEVGDMVQAGDALLEITPDPTPMELVDAERKVQIAEAA